jgi:hypothetical protein
MVRQSEKSFEDHKTDFGIVAAKTPYDDYYFKKCKKEK